MEFKGLIGWVYNLADFIMRLAYVNLLWLLFSVMGVGVLGIFPSTAGLYAVTRKWVMKETDISVWKTYWHTFKSEFGKANLVGYLFVIIGVVLYVDHKFFIAHGGSAMTVLSYFFLMLMILFFVMCLYLFPVYSHFELKALQYLKQTFFIMMLRPFESVLMVAASVAVYYLMLASPGLIVFFSLSLPAYFITWLAQRGFSKLGEKEENREEVEK